MGHEEVKAATRQAVEELLEVNQPLGARLKSIEARVEGTNKLRNAALITAVLCLVAAAFSVGYALTSRQQLDEQVETNRNVVCANARSTALAFREPAVSSSGKKEGKEHFLERMLAQRETLLAAADLNCPDIAGFDTFEYLRGKALAEIDRILQQEAPGRFRRLREHEGSLGSLPERVAPNPDSSPSAATEAGHPVPAGGPQSPVGTPAPAGDGTPPGPSRHPPQHGDGGGKAEGGAGHGGGGPEGAAGGGGGAGGEGGAGGGGGEAGGGGPAEEGGSSEGGVIGDPGGAVGEVVCLPNKLGVPICPEER